MAAFVLFVTPGVGPGGAASAKARYDGDDEAFEGLDAQRIREVAEELVRAHALVVDAHDEPDEDGTPGGIDLEEQRDVVGVDARVDRWGVTVTIYSGDSKSDADGNLERGAAVARTASRLLGGAVYDAENGRMLDLSFANAELARAAAEAFGRPVAGIGSGKEKRAAIALAFLTFVPIVATTLARRHLSGASAFFLVFGLMAAGAVFVSWWVRRPARPKTSAPQTGPRPIEKAPPGNEPIRPS